MIDSYSYIINSFTYVDIEIHIGPNVGSKGLEDH